LSDEFHGDNRVTPQGVSRQIASHWRHSQERLTIQLDLNASDGSSVGQLLLYHDAEIPILVRVELIRTVLRASLVQALQNVCNHSFSNIAPLAGEALESLHSLQV